jgi:hypothetical protein
MRTRWLKKVVGEANKALSMSNTGYYITTAQMENGEIRVCCESKMHSYCNFIPRKPDKLQTLLTIAKVISHSILFATNLFPEVYNTSDTTIQISVWRWLPGSNRQSETLFRWTAFLETDETITLIGTNPQNPFEPVNLCIYDFFALLIGVLMLSAEARGDE